MCWKVDHRIECVKCGYPYSEARYADTGEYDCEGHKKDTATPLPHSLNPKETRETPWN